ncbi:hypothetical protein SSX86_014851 [Deinandra increscens subsp. villosa]|uniref:UEV domain-containing protein n=1 Tax=Deinandra increscens subsp. villosa TaxID=3103831 RepID=A0AAP0D3E3_9ASTR
MAPPPSSSLPLPLPLPYSEDLKPLIDQHLLALSKSHPSLLQKTATFTHNDGRSVTLLQSDGTVPMVFQNVTYNIPVLIWLTETYPRNPPLVFVNPTRDMVIRRSHPFVNQSGLVWIPYLENWVFPSSNLVDLARDLSSYFGYDPPLYSVPRPNPNPNFMEAWFSAQAVLLLATSSLLGVIGAQNSMNQIVIEAHRHCLQRSRDEDEGALTFISPRNRSPVAGAFVGCSLDGSMVLLVVHDIVQSELGSFELPASSSDSSQQNVTTFSVDNITPASTVANTPATSLLPPVTPLQLPPTHVSATPALAVGKDLMPSLESSSTEAKKPRLSE